MVDIAQAARERRNVSIYDKKVRGIAYQAALAVSLTVIIVGIATQTVSNMKQRGIPLTFDFWNQTAGFQSSQTLIPYDALSTYGQAFWVGVANTLLVSAFGILLATSIGFVIGISRLSSNWIVAKVATSYVEVVRNIPLLLQLHFWSNAVLKPLPAL
ncbi:MAG: ABC transporter permease subunit, partial [Shinella sp.]